jgi:iron-sulfur cluster repair protein YtfE (RIC family)
MLWDLDKIAGAPAAQRDVAKLVRLAELFKDHLVLHAWCEDTFYYPAVREGVIKNSMAPLSVAYMDHLDEEHKAVDGYLDRLEHDVKNQPPLSTWPQTFALFSKGLIAHMKKEEEELFPLSEKLLGAERLEALSRDLEQHRSEAPKARIHTRS